MFNCFTLLSKNLSVSTRRRKKVSLLCLLVTLDNFLWFSIFNCSMEWCVSDSNKTSSVFLSVGVRKKRSEGSQKRRKSVEEPKRENIDFLRTDVNIMSKKLMIIFLSFLLSPWLDVVGTFITFKNSICFQACARVFSTITFIPRGRR